LRFLRASIQFQLVGMNSVQDIPALGENVVMKALSPLNAIDAIERLRSDLRTHSKGTAERATVILHGDHGSRITRKVYPQNQNLPEWPRMLRDGFSALFAVRAPGRAPGLEPVVKPITRLVQETPERLPLPEPVALFLMLPGKPESNQVVPLPQKYPISPNIFSQTETKGYQTDFVRKE
jgi:hypothetical protein